MPALSPHVKKLMEKADAEHGSQSEETATVEGELEKADAEHESHSEETSIVEGEMEKADAELGSQSEETSTVEEEMFSLGLSENEEVGEEEGEETL